MNPIPMTWNPGRLAGPAAVLVAMALAVSSATGAEPPEPASPPATNSVSLVAEPAPALPAAEDTPSAPETPPRPTEPAPVAEAAAATAPSDNPDELRLNFRGAPLEMVLNYLSEAAGFIIVLETTPRGRVDVFSGQPLTRDEAVDLLNTVLQKNGYAAIRKGRTLTIVNRDEVKTRGGVPVKSGSDPESIPDNDEIVTQIIPVRFVEVGQLLRDLQPLVSTQTAITANESGNAIVITDTQSRIRRVAEIIKAIDMGAEDVTEVRVFPLRNSDPVEMSELLTSLFPDDSRSGGSQSPVRFGGFRDFFRGGGPPGAGGNTGGSNSQNQRIRKRARVIVVPDQRTSSVAVTAAGDLMNQIAEVIDVLDQNPAKKQTVRVIPLENADPEETLEVLQDIFQKNTTTQSRRTTQGSALQNRSDQQMQQNYQSSGSTRGGMSNTRRTSSTRR